MGDRGQIAREVRDPLIPDLQIRTHRQTHRHRAKDPDPGGRNVRIKTKKMQRTW